MVQNRDFGRKRLDERGQIAAISGLDLVSKGVLLAGLGDTLLDPTGEMPANGPATLLLLLDLFQPFLRVLEVPDPETLCE